MTYDFFKLAQEKVETILTNRKIDIDFKDDDTFADFMIGEIDNHKFTHGEKQYLYTYNCMLQTIYLSVDDVSFSMTIKPYLPNMTMRDLRKTLAD